MYTLFINIHTFTCQLRFSSGCFALSEVIMEKNIQWPHIAYVFYLWSVILYGNVDLCGF